MLCANRDSCARRRNYHVAGRQRNCIYLIMCSMKHKVRRQAQHKPNLSFIAYHVLVSVKDLLIVTH